MRLALIALAALLPLQAKPDGIDLALKKTREATVARLLPLLKWCGPNRAWNEGKGLLTLILQLVPDHKEAIALHDAYIFDNDETYMGTLAKPRAEFCRRMRDALFDILDAYDGAAAFAEKSGSRPRADAIGREFDAMTVPFMPLDPLPDPRPATIKGLEGPFTLLQARCGISVVTNLDSDDHPRITSAVDDACDAFMQFFDRSLPGLRLKRPPAATLHCFRSKEQADAFLRLGGATIDDACPLGSPSCFHIDPKRAPLAQTVRHHRAHLLDRLMLGKTNRPTPWIAEGLACFFESADRAGFRVHAGKRSDTWELTGPTRFFDLDRFCDLDAAQWDLESVTAPEALAAQASALFRYFTMGRKGDSRDRFIKEAVLGGRSGSRGISEAFGLKTLGEIESDFKAYANTIYRQKIE